MLLLLLLYIFSSAKGQPSVTCAMASPKDLAHGDDSLEDHGPRDHAPAEDILQAIQNLLLASRRVSDPRECTVITVGYVGTQTK